MDAICEWLKTSGGYAAGVNLYLQHGTDTMLKKLFSEAYSSFKEQKLRQALENLVNPLPLINVVPTPHLPPDTFVALTSDDVKAWQQLVKEKDSAIDELSDEKEQLEERVDELQDEVYDLENSLEDLQDENKKLQRKAQNTPKGWPPEMDLTVKDLYDKWLPIFLQKKNLQSRIYDIALAGKTNDEKKREAGAMAHRILDLRDECRKIYQKRDQYLATGKLPEEPKLIDIPEDPKKWPITLANWQRYIRDYRNKLKKKPDNEDFKKQLEKYEWGVAELKKLLGD